MIVYPLASQHPNCGGHAIGASLGETHLRALGDELRPHPILPGRGELVILDYSRITTATASYLKATLLWLHLCGQMTRNNVPGAFPVVDSANPAACELFPMAAYVSPEVVIELDEVFGGRALPCLVAQKWNKSSVHSARLLGKMEPTVRRTFDLLLQAGRASAADLHHAHGAQESIALTAWNNRLVELFRLRLCRRSKQGKHWIYEPVTREVIYG